MPRTNRNSVTVRVPAKVNLQLAVGPREADGFHNLVTVFQAISIYDDVTITKSAPNVSFIFWIEVLAVCSPASP